MYLLPRIIQRGVFLSECDKRTDIKKIRVIEQRTAILTPLNKLISLSDNVLKEHFLSSHSYQNEDIWLYKISNAYLAAPYGLICTGDFKLVRDTISFDGSGRVGVYLLNSYLKDPLQVKKNFHAKAKMVGAEIDVLDTAISMCSVWVNFFHWIVEELPKLRAREVYFRETGVLPKIVIPSKKASYIIESLRCMGIDVEKETVRFNNDSIYVNNLVVQTFPEITPSLIKYLRSRILDNLKLSTKNKGNRRVYISRERVGNRNVLNGKELKKLLDFYNFDEVALEDLSFTEQVELMNQASIVISCHGAGLTNVLWGNNLDVIELFGYTIKTTYARLCEACDHRYQAIAGVPVEKNHRSNFSIDVSEIEKILNQWNY